MVNNVIRKGFPINEIKKSPLKLATVFDSLGTLKYGLRVRCKVLAKHRDIVQNKCSDGYQIKYVISTTIHKERNSNRDKKWWFNANKKKMISFVGKIVFGMQN